VSGANSRNGQDAWQAFDAHGGQVSAGNTEEDRGKER
jgi:hypothetical protein